MKLTLKYCFWLLLSISTAHLQAQTPEIGSWVDYLPYSNVKSIVDAGDVIYAATDYGLIQWNKSDNSIDRLSKVHGLSDVGVTSLDYHNETQTVFIGYENGNIDLIKNNRILNFADIKRDDIVANKSVNNITFYGDTAFLSCGFGIVLFSMEREEVIDTYVLGDGGNFMEINDLVVAQDTIFCATESGVFKAGVAVENLKYYGAWEKMQNVPHPNENYDIIQYFGGQLFINLPVDIFTNDTLYQYDWTAWAEAPFTENDINSGLKIFNDQMIVCHSGIIDFVDTNFLIARVIPSYNTDLPPGPNEAIVDDEGIVWVADRNQGIVKSISDFNNQLGLLTSPTTVNVDDVSFQDNNVWVSAGTKVGNQGNAFNFDGVFRYDENLNWTQINRSDYSILDSVVDIIATEADPRNKGKVYAASLGSGIIEFENYLPVKIYDENNSPLVKDDASNSILSMDLEFDSKGNLWMLTTGSTSFLTVKTNDDEWYTFDFADYFPSSIVTSKLVVTQDGVVWVVLREGQGILVFDPNETFDDTADDQIKVLQSSSGNGGIHNTDIRSIAEDLDGEIWIGTAEGVAVFFSPGSVFTDGANFDAQRIFVTVNGFTQYLLETEVVTSLAVDGANRKWFGTQKTGAFLMSEDGTEQLYHMREDNSALFSNELKVVKVNPYNGEVFFGSEKGLQAYKGTATEADPFFNDVYAYPNPVRENFDGLIAVKGLARNSNVKIIDINGSLVFETYSEGGQATWNGRNMEGTRVATGVYIVLAVDSEGEEREATKILFIH